MDSDKLKKMFPFLKNVDLEDSATKKKFGLGIACAIMALLLLILAIASSARKKHPQGAMAAIEQAEQVPEQKTELLEIPEGEGENILDAPNMISARERQRSSRGSNLKDLYGRSSYGEDPLADMEEEPEDARPISREEEIARMRARHGGVDVAAEQAPANSDQPQAPAAPKTKKINRSGPSATAQTQQQRVQEPEPEPETEPEPEPEPSEASVTEAQKTVRKSGGISSLDDWGSVDGIGGLDAEDQYVTVDASRPVKVMFVREQKITTGQRVSLRLLDDIAADGILIPKNTHLSAQCSIGERLEIRVNNIEINGKIINLGYTAFDNDGNQGLYCPEATEHKAQKQATERASSMGQSLLQSVLPGASQVVSSGSSIVKSATGKISAQISAGYTFFLLKDEY